MFKILYNGDNHFHCPIKGITIFTVFFKEKCLKFLIMGITIFTVFFKEKCFKFFIMGITMFTVFFKGKMFKILYNGDNHVHCLF